jgi:hypothetical protein
MICYGEKIQESKKRSLEGGERNREIQKKGRREIREEEL